MSDWRTKGLRIIELRETTEKAYREYLQKLQVLNELGPDMPREDIAVVCGFICQRLEDIKDAQAEIDSLEKEFRIGATAPK